MVIAVVPAGVMGCGRAEVVPPGVVGPPPASLDELPACRPPARPSPGVDVPGVFLPAGGYLTVAEEDGPLTVANGWVEMTPAQVRAHYEGDPQGWDVLVAEDEKVEAEILVGSEQRRLFVQAIAACPVGSDLYVRLIEDVGLPDP